MTRVETVNRGNQSQCSGRDQVVQVDALRKSFMNTPGDQTHLRQMFENQELALLGGVVAGLIFLKTTAWLFDCDLSFHAATVPNFVCPTGCRFKTRSRISSSVAGSKSSGIRWPQERNETGLPMRMLWL